MLEFENHAPNLAALLPYAVVFFAGLIVGMAAGAYLVYQKLK
ncbi:hypothetical protein [Pseudomonas sp. PA15(2017)]|nr:hypothetical protein [Pseudomonas sp. PA15(2017)]